MSVFWGPKHQVEGRGQLSDSWSHNSLYALLCHVERHVTCTASEPPPLPTPLPPHHPNPTTTITKLSRFTVVARQWRSQHAPEPQLLTSRCMSMASVGPLEGGVKDRSWWKHEQQSVRAAVVSAMHHSCDVGSAQHHTGDRRTHSRRRRKRCTCRMTPHWDGSYHFLEEIRDCRSSRLWRW